MTGRVVKGLGTSLSFAHDVARSALESVRDSIESAVVVISSSLMRFGTLFSIALVIALMLAGLVTGIMWRAGASPSTLVIAALAMLVAILLPSVISALWSSSRSDDLRELTARARRIIAGDFDASGVSRNHTGALAEHARVLEDLRAQLERHQQEAAEQRAVMTEIVASIGEGLLAVSRTGRIVVANRRLAEMLDDAHLTDLQGRSVLEVVRKSAVVTAIEGALRGQASRERVTFGTAANERQIEMRTFPVEGSAEIAAVALFIDVSAIVRLQRIRQDFIDDFSHEIRTPLAGIRSASETLDQEGLRAEDEQQLRQVMHRQIARIERLVRDLSELNHIESGQIVLRRQPADLRAILAELCEEFERRGVRTSFELSGESTIIPVDAGRVQQIFTNVLDNAIKHGGEESRVTIEISEDARRREAVINVSDQGPGIPDAELDRIFNRFYRVDRSRSAPGTGLGLAIAKHLVLAHGGTIRAFNRPSGGATFEVRLPVQP
ncbi:MAG TPA: ATP-binding protein [Thermoanaerobaculia bacterium]